MRESTAEVPHQIAAAHLPEAASVCDAATAPDTTLAMLDPQPTLVELLGRHVLLPHALLLQIEINSQALHRTGLQLGEPYSCHGSCLLSLYGDVGGASYQKESGINSNVEAARARVGLRPLKP